MAREEMHVPYVTLYGDGSIAALRIRSGLDVEHRSPAMLHPRRQLVADGVVTWRHRPVRPRPKVGKVVAAPGTIPGQPLDEMAGRPARGFLTSLLSKIGVCRKSTVALLR